MRAPYIAYFAGISTVVAALAVGFGGGLMLTGTSAMKSTSVGPTTAHVRTKSTGATSPNVSNPDVAQAQTGAMTPRAVAAVEPEQAHPALVTSESADMTADKNADSVPAESSTPPVNMNLSAPAAPQIQTHDAVAQQALQAKKLAAEKKQADRRKYAREREAMERGRLNRENTDDEDARVALPGAGTMFVRRYEAQSDRYHDDDDE